MGHATTRYLNQANPPWLQELARARQEQGRTLFLLHFNIRDLVFDPAYPPDAPDDLLSVADFLATLLSNRDVILTYSLHSGIEMRKGASEHLAQSFKPREGEALWQDIANHASSTPFPLDPGQGRPTEDPAPPHRWRVPGRVFPLLTRALTHPYTIPSVTEPATPADAPQSPATHPLSIGLIIDYLHHLVPEPGTITRHEVAELLETLQRWSTDPRLREHNHLVLMLTPELAAVHPELRSSDSRITALRIPRLTRPERHAFLQWLATTNTRQAEATGDDTPAPEPAARFPLLREPGILDELANRTSGMNYTELLDFTTAMQRNPEDDWRDRLKQRRDEIIQRESGGLLVPKESPYGLDDVAGYRYVRDYIDRIIPRLRQGRADVSGILFAGPPGTGKSFYAAALARDAGVNVVVMRNVRNMYVGQSERNLEQVLEVARTLAPVIIFVDEIDQAFANRQAGTTDSGIEQRLLGRLLEFMDDKDNLGNVIWIAASNRPDLVDDALLSRFRLRIPFLLPDQATCHELLRHQLPRQAGFCWMNWTAANDEAIARSIVGRYSGRELETIARSALWKAEDDERYRGHPEAWQRRKHEREAGGYPPLPSPSLEPPEASEAETDGTIAVHASYLLEAIGEASVGHNEQEYLRQSLLALQWAPFASASLLTSLQTALPPDIIERILDPEHGRMNKAAISMLLEDLRPAPLWNIG